MIGQDWIIVLGNDPETQRLQRFFSPDAETAERIAKAMAHNANTGYKLFAICPRCHKVIEDRYTTIRDGAHYHRACALRSEEERR